jgi:hypothetical protein
MTLKDPLMEHHPLPPASLQKQPSPRYLHSLNLEDEKDVLLSEELVGFVRYHDRGRESRRNLPFYVLRVRCGSTARPITL